MVCRFLVLMICVWVFCRACCCLGRGVSPRLVKYAVLLLICLDASVVVAHGCDCVVMCCMRGCCFPICCSSVSSNAHSVVNVCRKSCCGVLNMFRCCCCSCEALEPWEAVSDITGGTHGSCPLYVDYQEVVTSVESSLSWRWRRS